MKKDGGIVVVYFSLIFILSLAFVASSCTDSDEGMDYYMKGDLLIQQGDASITGSDYCFDSSVNIPDGTTYWQLVQIALDNSFQIEEQATGEYLLETICESQTVNDVEEYTQAITYTCPNGCVYGVCIREPYEPPEGEECFSACLLNHKCYPFGYRKAGEYCSDNLEFVLQLEGDAICENNFECISNLCIDGKCTEPGFFQRIIAWFRNLFGS